jgi:hypothetical protein
MRIYKKEINEFKMSGYNDSGAQWVIQGGDHSGQRFDKRQWPLKAAFEFYARIYNYK